jgi:hypothetical protein
LLKLSLPRAAGIRGYLAAAGIDIAPEVGKDNLVLSSDQWHLIRGRLIPVATFIYTFRAQYRARFRWNFFMIIRGSSTMLTLKVASSPNPDSSH